MKITTSYPVAYGGAFSADNGQLRLLRTHLRSLGAGTGEFSVVRDPATNRFVVQVLDPASKAVVDQFPAEDVLKRMAGNRVGASLDHGSPGGRSAAGKVK